ncbi:SH3-like domain-containing protein [Planktotalea sp.]|uniref:SH3-like domain-containing protein n=1 Tax=Planktotalea sp. TaxID=2029877 RepID=UPI003D6AB8FC
MPPGHVRAPAYLRGKTGTIERTIATFKNPEKLAYGLPAEERMLYRVRFSAQDLWGEAAERADDMIEAEIYAHWINLEETEHAT